MNRTALLIISVGLIIFMAIILSGSPSPSSAQNVEIKNGVQYITIDAKGGYSPNTSTAKAGIPTKLIVKTKSTFDCSAALSIRSVNFQKLLPQNGETEINIGIPKAGEPLQGTCSMGMYGFVINFEN